MRVPLVKLIFGLIGREEMIHDIEKELEKYGPVDLRSPIIPFDFTSYYEKEMGKDLKRRWISVDCLIPENELKRIKLETIEIENKYRVEGNRTINIDPGGVSDTRLLLPTTKNYAHRIYLGDGIFCEVTLLYRRKTGWENLPWTYPDYRTELAHKFFEEVRRKFLEDRKRERGGLNSTHPSKGGQNEGGM